MSRCRNCKKGEILAFLCTVTILLCSISPLSAQEKSDSIARLNLFGKVERLIDVLLNNIDSSYVRPNTHNMTFTPEYRYNYEYYRFSSDDAEQSIMIAPDSRNRIFFNIGWRWLSVGYGIDLSEHQPSTDFSMNLYSPRIGLDLFYRKNNKGHKIRKLSGFEENGAPLARYNDYFDGLTVKQLGFNLYYIFNRRFSYPAAYSNSTNQRMSAGSFILGVNYNEQDFTFDYTGLDSRILQLMRPGMKFDKIKFHDLSLNFGYSYNWVFAKNCVANLSLTPAIGYKNTSLKLKNTRNLLSSINFDLITRAAVVYNNGKYYAGASLVSHTYSYNKSQISLVNGFGYVKVFVGFKFWRRK